MTDSGTKSLKHDPRAERRRVRLFFAGLLVASAILDIVGALLAQHQTRSQVLESVVPTSISLGGRTGVVLSGLTLLLLAGGVARGKRIAWQLTSLVLLASIGFDLIKDLDIEDFVLSAWILLGLWWFRSHFDADSDPRRLRWGLAVLAGGVTLAVAYAVFGTLVLTGQLALESGVVVRLELLAEALIGNPTGYRALTERATWFVSTIPIVSYGLVVFALLLLLRPVFAPRAVAADRERVHQLLQRWGRNPISHLAVHGSESYHWIGDDLCVAFSLRGRTALALGDPIGPPDALERGTEAFIGYCERQDWIPAFYEVGDDGPYRQLGLTMVPIGSEAIIRTQDFTLRGNQRQNIRHMLHRAEHAGVRVTLMPAPEARAQMADQLQAVSGQWLGQRGPELNFSLGTLETLSDPDITVGVAFSAQGRLEAFVSWLPSPARKSWTLDLMRRRPDAELGVMEALIVRSIEEGRSRGIEEMSLGVAPRVIPSGDASGAADRLLRAVYWGLDRFRRGSSLHRFKAKFGPCWEDRYLAVPGASTLPEVLIAVVRAHLPPISGAAVWVRSVIESVLRPATAKPSPAA
jgi:phosphatidylglycerol lysyltransferase